MGHGSLSSLSALSCPPPPPVRTAPCVPGVPLHHLLLYCGSILSILQVAISGECESLGFCSCHPVYVKKKPLTINSESPGGGGLPHSPPPRTPPLTKTLGTPERPGKCQKSFVPSKHSAVPPLGHTVHLVRLILRLCPTHPHPHCLCRFRCHRPHLFLAAFTPGPESRISSKSRGYV